MCDMTRKQWKRKQQDAKNIKKWVKERVRKREKVVRQQVALQARGNPDYEVDANELEDEDQPL